MQGSYVYSRLDGVQTGINTNSTAVRNVFDFTNPNNTIDLGQGPAQGRGSNDQPHAFKILGSYQAPYGVTIGANYQALTGLPYDRTLNVSFAQGTHQIAVDPRGTYRQDTLSLLSLRADKTFNLGGGNRVGLVFELHNALNSNAGQNSYGVLTQSFASQAAFDAARLTTSYFGRVQEIVAPRVFKLGLKYTF